MYEYQAKYIDNYDGDTIHFQVDLGFGIFHSITVRLWNIDTYEMNSKNEKEKQLALDARNFVRDRLLNSDNIVIQTFKDKKEKYGRYLAIVIFKARNGEMKDLAEEIRKECCVE